MTELRDVGLAPDDERTVSARVWCGAGRKPRFVVRLMWEHRPTAAEPRWRDFAWSMSLRQLVGLRANVRRAKRARLVSSRRRPGASLATRHVVWRRER